MLDRVRMLIRQRLKQEAIKGIDREMYRAWKVKVDDMEGDKDCMVK